MATRAAILKTFSVFLLLNGKANLLKTRKEVLERRKSIKAKIFDRYSLLKNYFEPSLELEGQSTGTLEGSMGVNCK